MFSQGKIYKLQDDAGYFYIGSTCKELAYRLNLHKDKQYERRSTKLYSHFNKTMKIYLLEEYPCETKDELSKREDEYIQKELENPLCLNSNRAYTKEDPVEIRKEYLRKYRETHRATLNANAKRFREKKKLLLITNAERKQENDA